MSKLFEPLRVGRMELSNRIALAPLTRFRANDDHVPLPFVKEYYAQRASTPGTLLITEATYITSRAGGYPNVPGIWNEAQIAGWKEVTDAVHAKGSYIFAQIWALGRVAPPQGETAPVSSSETPASADSPVPRALTDSEIQEWIQDYAQAAKNAIAAGFDGVEIHAANGYLIDQFNQDNCNKRTDRWGGSVENRARFAIETVKAVVEAVGADRTGIRFSPFSTFQGMKMQDPVPQFKYLAEQMKPFKLAYAHVVEARIAGNVDIEASESLDFFFQAYEKASPIIVAGGFKPDSAREAVDVHYKDHDVLVAFGRSYIANPDLPFRVKSNIPLTPYDRDMFYRPKDPVGYIDYEFSPEFKAAQAAEVAA
ncbi:Aldolase-type TIM barrel [Penicillium verhagenii]|uniref:Aldolase-type TIM barrel n=1 Tax=Penicillium verhagenii TaxID=1562060 RepID=UPI0025455DF7|nr:Aldolase-type TIM barrel [Penicillium verhagenii]KAJ5947798.1 Aldolase-type TIM barrel [Penicillium verhagenii]